MSSSTTKKFREFMAEPLGDKGIRDVPGIGDVLGAKLSEAGYEKVCFPIEFFYLIYLIEFFFLFRHILYLVNSYYVIKKLNDFKIGYKHNVEQIVIRLMQQHKLFLNGLKRLFKTYYLFFLC
jgi:hypothetical protein